MMMNVLFESRIANKKVTIYGTLENPLFAVKEVVTWLDGLEAVQRPNLYHLYKAVKEEDLVSIEYFNGNIQHFENYLTLAGVFRYLTSLQSDTACVFATAVEALISDMVESYSNTFFIDLGCCCQCNGCK